MRAGKGEDLPEEILGQWIMALRVEWAMYMNVTILRIFKVDSGQRHEGLRVDHCWV